MEPLYHALDLAAAIDASPDDAGEAATDAGLCDCVILRFEAENPGAVDWASFLSGVLMVQYMNPLAKLERSEISVLRVSLEIAAQVIEQGEGWDSTEQEIVFDGLIARAKMAEERNK